MLDSKYVAWKLMQQPSLTPYQIMHSDHLWGTTSARTDPYHIAVVRGPMTRGILSRFHDIKDEIVHSCRELLPVSDGKQPSY